MRRVAAGGLFLLPLVVLPDLGAGLLGRLAPVEYPSGWEAVRAELVAAPDGADVVSLPWQAFRRYPWNGDRAVLDPLPRYLDRVVVTSGDLPVATDDGVTTIRGEDPRAARVGAMVARGQPLAPSLVREGIGWAVVQRDTPGLVEPGLLEGAELVLHTPSLLLYRLVDESDLPEGAPWPRFTAAVVVMDLLVLVLVVTGILVTAVDARTAATVREPHVRGRSG